MRSIAFAVTLACAALQAQADDALTGNWKLVSFYTEDTQTHQRTHAYGDKPVGAIGFTPAGRFFAFATAADRKPPRDTEAQAASFRSTIAYTGQYRLEGDRFITRVDVAWNPDWVGTEQVRYWRVQPDGLLAITTAPLPNPNVPGSTMVGTLVWERER